MAVAISSDKGLCGGINSTVSKYTRAVLKATEGGERTCKPSVLSGSTVAVLCSPAQIRSPASLWAPVPALNSCEDRDGAAWCSCLRVFRRESSAEKVVPACLAVPAPSCWAQVPARTS